MARATDEYYRLTGLMSAADAIAADFHDQLDAIWAKLTPVERVVVTQRLAYEPHDHEHPDEVAKRALCAVEGHLTVNELEHTEATHGVRDVCRRCGRFWHREPVPAEMK